jgi:HEPN domain-containing protein
MSEQPEARAEAAAVWFAYAADDLETARRSLGEPMLPAQVCFHSQQAVEKALKGYLVRLGQTDIPFTHDLRQLARLVVSASGKEPPMPALRLLNRYSVQVRYPPTPPPTPSEARQALVLAEELLAFLRTEAETAEAETEPQAEAETDT